MLPLSIEEGCSDSRVFSPSRHLTRTLSSLGDQSACWGSLTASEPLPWSKTARSLAGWLSSWRCWACSWRFLRQLTWQIPWNCCTGSSQTHQNLQQSQCPGWSAGWLPLSSLPATTRANLMCDRKAAKQPVMEKPGEVGQRTEWEEGGHHQRLQLCFPHGARWGLQLTQILLPHATL